MNNWRATYLSDLNFRTRGSGTLFSTCNSPAVVEAELEPNRHDNPDMGILGEDTEQDFAPGEREIWDQYYEHRRAELFPETAATSTTATPRDISSSSIIPKPPQTPPTRPRPIIQRDINTRMSTSRDINALPAPIAQPYVQAMALPVIGNSYRENVPEFLLEESNELLRQPFAPYLETGFDTMWERASAIERVNRQDSIDRDRRRLYDSLRNSGNGLKKRGGYECESWDHFCTPT